MEEIKELVNKATKVRDGESVFGNIKNVHVIITKSIEDNEYSPKVYYTTHYSYRTVGYDDVGKTCVASFVPETELVKVINYNVEELLEDAAGSVSPDIHNRTNVYNVNLPDNNNITKLISTKDVFSEEVLNDILTNIMMDEKDRILLTKEEKQKVELIDVLEANKHSNEYALYAYKLTLYDFIQEFEDYIGISSKAEKEYIDFMNTVQEGKIKISISK